MFNYIDTSCKFWNWCLSRPSAHEKWTNFRLCGARTDRRRGAMIHHSFTTWYTWYQYATKWWYNTVLWALTTVPTYPRLHPPLVQVNSSVAAAISKAAPRRQSVETPSNLDARKRDRRKMHSHTSLCSKNESGIWKYEIGFSRNAEKWKLIEGSLMRFCWQLQIFENVPPLRGR